MARALTLTDPPTAPYQRANAIKRRFGINEWTLKNLAVNGVVRCQLEQSVTQRFSVEDVERHLEQQRKTKRSTAALATK